MPRKKKELTQWRDIVKRLDEVFSKYIRLRDSFVRNGIRRVQCPLCWSIIPREKAQNMHFVKRSVMKYRFSEINCHAGCYRCNVALHGNYIVYTRRMQMKYWLSKVDEMIRDKQTYKRYTRELKEMINEYTQKCEEILNWEPLEKKKKKKLKQEKLLDCY